MSPTIKDVARHAGVSVATVSRYLNQSPFIAKDSIEKVKASMETLHYQPNSLAKSLSKQKSLNIAFVVDSSNTETSGNDYFLHIQYGVEQKLGQMGYYLLIISIEANETGIIEIEKIAREKRIDGLLMPAALATDQMIDMLEAVKIPFVVFGRCDRQNVWSLDLDNTMGGRAAAEKLLLSGKERIAFVTNSFDKVFVQERFEGYQSALLHAGITLHSEDVIEGCYTSQDGFNCIMEDKRGHDAYIVTDNVVAFGVLKALSDKKIRVPEEAQLISFDDSIAAQLSSPVMTIIDINVFQLGIQAAEMLMNQFSGRVCESVVKKLMPVSLIERGSTI